MLVCPDASALLDETEGNTTEAGMSLRHLNQIDLADRWNISHRTLERWRWTGEGPRFVKLGGRVVYRLADVEAFEREQVRSSTSSKSALKSA